MMSTRNSEANSTRKLVQQLRSTKPESVVDACRELRIPPRG